MDKRQTSGTEDGQQHEAGIDAQLAPIALGTVANDQPEYGLDKLTQGGHFGLFDSAAFRAAKRWF